MAVKLVGNSYGKGDVRLTRLSKDGSEYAVHQLSTHVALEGDFAAAYINGDNRMVIPTDTVKNTMYVLARQFGVPSPEAFALHTANHFLTRYPHVTGAKVLVEETPWERLVLDGKAHPHAFLGGSSERRVFEYRQNRGEAPSMLGGIDGLLVLKATGSAWLDFWRDEYTTLEDREERILSTIIKARWRFATPPTDWNLSFAAIRSAMIEKFATHHSPGVQRTILELGEAALAACPQVDEVTITLPNKHHLPVDLTPLGLDNPHLVFQPVDEPYGLIEGVMRRE